MARVDSPGSITFAATPIGNLADATTRLTRLLAQADIIAAEDTRTVRRLASGLGVVIKGKVVAHHEHNEAVSAIELVELAEDGAEIVFVSDAGMPLVSDPGYRLAQAAIEADVTITAAPGASAVMAALVVSGLPADRFAFEGFVPRKQGEKTRFFDALADETRTLIFYESPHRIAHTLAAVAESFGEDRQICVARELTKLHEEVVRGTAAEVLAWAENQEQIRGEIVLLTAGAEPKQAGLEEQLAEVDALTADGIRLKDACKQVAHKHGSKTRDLYQAALDR